MSKGQLHPCFSDKQHVPHRVLYNIIGQILEVGKHEQLLQNEGGPYSRLVSAQRFREEQEKEDEASEDEKVDEKVLLTREEAEEVARDEMPAGTEFKRMGTDRSLGSEIMEQRRKQGRLVGGEKKRHSLFYLFKRMGQINSEEKWRYLIAFISAVVVGMIYPVFAIVFGNVIGVSSCYAVRLWDRSVSLTFDLR
jgi:ATP-binding cassette, subfamily B (MDR/TAP), member 1